MIRPLTLSLAVFLLSCLYRYASQVDLHAAWVAREALLAQQASGEIRHRPPLPPSVPPLPPPPPPSVTPGRPPRDDVGPPPAADLDPPTAPGYLNLGALVDRLDRGDYEGLEQDLEAIVPSPYASSRGAGLEDAVQPLAVSSLHRARLDRWIAARPRSWLPRALRGWLYYNEAFRQRGTGFAGTVSATGWEGFRSGCESARQDLEAAMALGPAWNLPRSGLLTVLATGDRDLPRMEALLAAGIAADPTDFSIPQRLMVALKPRWGGSNSAMLDFTFRSLKARPELGGLLDLLVIALDDMAQSAAEAGTTQTYSGESGPGVAWIEQAWGLLSPRAQETHVALGLRAELEFRVRGTRAAIPWIQRAMAAGSRRAAGTLAYFHETGEGLPRDPAKALDLNFRAARLGWLASIEHLADRFGRSDHGAPRDPVLHRRWLGAAAAHGSLAAMRSLASLHARGQDIPVDAAKARAWTRQAALRSDPESLYRLGVMASRGEGGPKDPDLAAQCFRVAAELGYGPALERLDAPAAPTQGR